MPQEEGKRKLDSSQGTQGSNSSLPEKNFLPRPPHAALQHLLPHALAWWGSLCLALDNLSCPPGSPFPQTAKCLWLLALSTLSSRGFLQSQLSRSLPEERSPVPEAGSPRSRQGAWPQNPRESVSLCGSVCMCAGVCVLLAGEQGPPSSLDSPCQVSTPLLLISAWAASEKGDSQ